MNRELLLEGLALSADDDAGLTTAFYERLFDDHPEVRDLFSADMRAQASMLQEALVAVLDHLDDPAWLQAHLGSLGARHAGYGVTPQMFGLVASTLVATMAERAGSQWTTPMTEAWEEALSAVAGLMLAGYPENAR
ncbi:globin domain-containing protein [Gordonia insulae]|uniref:Flavohemoprotein n=1 Tax=Gordonia insulae TaxID=2420509 RepID=A0A3G8JP00_9ACTN|nr:globin domain-containing protein [Gordonia insulae]AZG46678.1 Flavohemoprotein [Gordonia insulae]